MLTDQPSTTPHRCGGCGAWSLGWCGVCVHLSRTDAVQALLEAAEGRARRGELEANLPGTGYQHRPSASWVEPRRGNGAHIPDPMPQHAPYTGTGA